MIKIMGSRMIVSDPTNLSPEEKAKIKAWEGDSYYFKTQSKADEFIKQLRGGKQ